MRRLRDAKVAVPRELFERIYGRSTDCDDDRLKSGPDTSSPREE
jgi:hypothetical protein